MEDPVHANHHRLRNEAAEPRNLLGENNVRHTMEVIENWRRDMMSLQVPSGKYSMFVLHAIIFHSLFFLKKYFL